MVDVKKSAELVIDGLRHRVRKRGWTTLADLQAFFESCDSEVADGRLSIEEFTQGMLTTGMVDSEEDCRVLFHIFDMDRSGSVEYAEFLSMIRGRLNTRRKAVVLEAYRKFDVTGDGVINIEDLKKAFRTAEHPEYLTGQRSEDDIFNEFLRNFDTISHDGEVSFVEFEQYYENIGAMVENDDYFEAIVRNAWQLEGATGGHSMKVHVTDSFGRGQRVEIRGELNVDRHHPHFKAYVRERLAKMGHKDVQRFEILGRY